MPEFPTFKPSYLGMVSTIVGMIMFFILGFVFLIINPILGFVVFFIIFIILLFSYLSIKMTTYELREDGLFIKRGVIAKKQILLLYTQIQDVSEYQDLSNRIFGLKVLQIKTMTSSSAIAGILSNLKEQDADNLKQMLMQNISSSKNVNQKTNKNQVLNKPIQYDINKEQQENASNPYPVYFSKLGFVYGGIILFFIIATIIFLSKIDSSFMESEVFFNIIIFLVALATIPINYFIKQFTFKYWVSENTITIKSGWLNKKTTTIDYDKVQDIIISQNILTRIFGLASIHIETGSAEVMQGDNSNNQLSNYDIEILKLEHANIVINQLMPKIKINYTPNSTPLISQIPLDNKKIIKKTIAGIFGLFVLCALVLITVGVLSSTNQDISSSIFSDVLFWTSIIFIIITVITLIYQKMYYDRYYYDWSRNTLTIRKGIIRRQQIYLPFEKVQNVFKDQDLLDRVFGLHDIHLSTVGNGSVDMCHIDGLTKENAEKLITALLKQVKENIN